MAYEREKERLENIRNEERRQMMRDNQQQIHDVQKMKQLKEVQEEVSLSLALVNVSHSEAYAGSFCHQMVSKIIEGWAIYSSLSVFLFSQSLTQWLEQDIVCETILLNCIMHGSLWHLGGCIVSSRL